MAARVLEWIGQGDKAIKTLNSFLERSPKHWSANKYLSLFFLRDDRKLDALKCAERLPKISPWKAASYDWLRYVAQNVDRIDVAEKAQRKGDEVFKQEKVLFDDLRSALRKA